MRLVLLGNGSALRRRLLQTLMCVATLAAVLPFGHGAANAAASEAIVEWLAGPTRYETAAAIAQQYVAEFDGSVDTAILVSGEDGHAACALAAAALAGDQRAPVLLTRSDELPAAAGEFLDSAGINRTFIVGGTDEVSPAVANHVQAIVGSEPTRLGGSDCYATAVAVARHLGPLDPIPGRGRTVLLTTGEDYADGLAAGPFAYRSRIPVLLARPAGLDPGVEDLLRGRVDRVIILGGPAAVSEDVRLAVEALGITVERWFGPSRYDTAGRIATELLTDPSLTGCFEGSAVGLAAGSGSSDALASSPLLGERCAPLLLVRRDVLTTATASFLGSSLVVGDADGVVRLTVLGGSEAVSLGVAFDAERAASQLDGPSAVPVLADIEASEGACHWTVTFSEPVLTADAELTDNYTFGQEPLPARLAEIDGGDAATTRHAIVLLAGASAYTSAEVPTGCAEPVAVRDRIGIVDGAIGASHGNGSVAAHEIVVRADTTSPSLSVLAPQGGDTVWVRSNEPLAAGTATVTLTRGRARKTQTAIVSQGDTGFSVAFSFPAEDSYVAADLAFTEPPWLHPGDKITIDRGKLADRAGNLNTSVTAAVVADTTAPTISAVTVTEPVARIGGMYTVDLVLRWSEPVRGCGIGPAAGPIDLGSIQIDIDGDRFADVSLDGHGAASAGVAFVAAPDLSEWTIDGTAACDHAWTASDGTLVARLSSATAEMLPHLGSGVMARAGAAHDLVGNPSATHQVIGFDRTGT